MNEQITQGQFADMVGVTQQAISDQLSRGVLQRGDTAAGWLRAYCRNLREQAAGRASMGDLDLVQERARLAKEQADKVAMANAVERRELAPVSLMEVTLSKLGRQIIGILEALPVNLKMNCPHLTTEDLALITAQIIKARNYAANIELQSDLSDDHDGTEEFN